MPKQNKRTYILALHDGGQRKITIPAHWKLTFGNVIPYYNKQNPQYTGNVENRIALRIYEGNRENLRAVMVDVKSFRAEEIEVLEKRAIPEEKRKLTQPKNGIADVELTVVAQQAWLSPEEIEAKENIPWPSQPNN